MQVRRVLLEYPAHDSPPANLLITFPSLKKRRKVGDDFDTLKDRLPLSYVLEKQVDALDTVLVKSADTAVVEPEAKKRETADGVGVSAQPNLVQASATAAKHLLQDAGGHTGSLDQQFERQLLRAADDDLFDQLILPLISVQLHVRGFTPKKDAMILYTVSTEQTDEDQPTGEDEENTDVHHVRRKRRAPTSRPQKQHKAYAGRIKIWSYALATEIQQNLDNEWFRNARLDAVKQIGDSSTSKSVVVVDAPLVGWWEVLPDTNLVVSTRRNVDIAVSEGIAPNTQDGVYYDQYKDVDNVEYSDAESMDYGQSDSDDFRGAYFDDSDDEEALSDSDRSSSTGNRYQEFLA